MSLLNVGARALLANQVVLHTTGHNIANVNTPGYSRQSVALETVPGLFTGGGYIGQGVDVKTIERMHSELLTRQSAAACAVQSADAARATQLEQLQEVFSGGSTGLGAAINDMMNAFADVISAPTDSSARTVVLTRMDESAQRMRAAAARVDELGRAAAGQRQASVAALGGLAVRMAQLNGQIVRARGNGQTPNDLLDQRDQLVREINQQLQTTAIAADDGSLGLFVAGSQPLVLGSTATGLALAEAAAFPGSGLERLRFERAGAAPVELDEDALGGGTLPGLLRFANHDLAEGRNLLGRIALGLGLTLNGQHQLGLTLDGAPGRPLFALPAAVSGHGTGAAAGGATVAFSDARRLTASDYELRFTGAGGAGQVVRLADGQATPFASIAQLAAQPVDGLRFNLTAAGAPGERLLFQPFATAAADLAALVHAPRDLAVANPVNAAMGAANGGTLQLAGLRATGLPDPPGLLLPANANPAAQPPTPGGVQLQFNAGPPITYDVFDRGTTPPTALATAQPYRSGAAIAIQGWQLRLQGTPNTGDTVLIGNARAPEYGDAFTRNAGNASALLALRELPLFDQAALTDGYAGAIAQIGTRSQSARFASELSASIAANLERERTAISAVNLDEEAARLIQYQQAYQASAKMIQIAQGIFDALIQGFGR